MSKQVQYRKVIIPKQDWSIPSEPGAPAKISREIWTELKNQFEEFQVNNKVNPHDIQQGLRSINFHKDHPQIYKVIEEMCLDYDLHGKPISGDDFVQFINDRLGDTMTRQGVTVLFDDIADPKKGVITPETLHQVIEELGDELSKEDVKYIMETIAEPSQDYNITLDELFYIMTKRPEDVVRITKVTKSM